MPSSTATSSIITFGESSFQRLRTVFSSYSVGGMKKNEHSGQILDTIGDEAASPLEQIVEEEDAEKLEGYVGGLPELYRSVARMRLLDGLQYKEIAEELGMELNTVRTRIRRAKAMIEALKAGED